MEVAAVTGRDKAGFSIGERINAEMRALQVLMEGIASSALREFVKALTVQPVPSLAVNPVRWSDLADLYGQFSSPAVPKAIVVDQRTRDALRRVGLASPAESPPFMGALGDMLGIPVVVRRDPRRTRPVRRTGPLVGRRARHAGALRVARLQRRVDRRAARRAPRPTSAMIGVF